MKIEDVIKLNEQEKNGQLPYPNCYKKSLTEDEQCAELERFNTLACISAITQERGVFSNFMYCSLVAKRAIKKCKYVNSFKGLGTTKTPYKIESKYGNGEIVNARELFKGKDYPKWFKPYKCFENSFNFSYALAKENVDAKLLSGILYAGAYPKLHSVVELPNFKSMGDCIVDFNYHFVISKDLYFKMLDFEILNCVDNKRFIENNIKTKNKEEILKNIDAMYIDFAYDDVLDYMDNKDKQKQNMDLTI